MLVESCPKGCNIGDPDRKKEYTYFEGSGNKKCNGWIAYKMRDKKSYYWYAFLDGCQYSIGHTIVVCGKHKKTLSNLFKDNELDYAQELMIALNQISDILVNTLSPKPEKIYVASLCDGEEHLHFHLIPRYPFDDDDVYYYFNRFRERDQLTIKHLCERLQDKKVGGFWYLGRAEKDYTKSQYWKKPIGERVKHIEEIARQLREAYEHKFRQVQQL